VLYLRCAELFCRNVFGSGNSLIVVFAQAYFNGTAGVLIYYYLSYKTKLMVAALLRLQRLLLVEKRRRLLLLLVIT
jgi:hypothetical protein